MKSFDKTSPIWEARKKKLRLRITFVNPGIPVSKSKTCACTLKGQPCVRLGTNSSGCLRTRRLLSPVLDTNRGVITNVNPYI